MKRFLLRSSSFIRASKRTVKKDSYIAEDIQAALKLLSEDAFHPRLKTHKLKGNLEGSWACSAGYDLRIVFKFIKYEGSEAVLLETVGSHELDSIFQRQYSDGNDKIRVINKFLKREGDWLCKKRSNIYCIEKANIMFHNV
ncbi:MAG: type II toxin-antitoxin system YafQ family toxin [Nitrospinae bacterium]|nr:type II toxin-antitoxin system YafQ family toxin [Nitrospinota bacterium]MBI3815071.1 type II toxin-antitoxin system YafQ family toxin [Nitrospinota bacterium]